jgi:hypothetical protein
MEADEESGLIHGGIQKYIDARYVFVREMIWRLLRSLMLDHSYSSCLFLSTSNAMQHYTMFFIVVSALHILSGFSAHHQELKNCTCSIGICQTGQHG